MARWRWTDLDHSSIWSELQRLCESEDWGDWYTFGPVGHHRVQALWENGNTNSFYITTGVMLAQKWSLDFMFNGGMVLKRAAHGREDGELLLCRCVSPPEVIQVYRERSDRTDHQKVTLRTMSGALILEETFDKYERCWYDVVKKLWGKKYYNPRLLEDSKLIQRQYWHLTLDTPLPAMDGPRDDVNLDVLREVCQGLPTHLGRAIQIQFLETDLDKKRQEAKERAKFAKQKQKEKEKKEKEKKEKEKKEKEKKRREDLKKKPAARSMKKVKKPASAMKKSSDFCE